MVKNEPLPDDTYALEILSLYEEDITQQWIEWFCNRLFAQLDDTLTFCIHSWLMDGPPNDKISETVVTADIIFLATQCTTVPVWVTDWLDSRAFEERSKPGALVIALGTEPQEPPDRDRQLFLQLRKLTDYLGLDLFWTKVCYEKAGEDLFG